MRGVTRDRIGNQNKEFHIVIKMEWRMRNSYSFFAFFYEAKMGSLSECLESLKFYSLIAADVTAAMLVERTMSKILLGI